MTLTLMNLFGLLAVVAGFKVITSKNPIHSVFYLVIAFINASLLLIMMGAEFLALTFLIVYVGAIAILFLFVVMLLNIRLVEILDNTTRYLPIGLLVAVIFFVEIIEILKSYVVKPNLDWIGSSIDFSKIYNITNIEALGQLLFTEYFIIFLISSLVLLVAMIGAILLTLTHEESVNRQDLFAQVATEWDKTVLLKK